MCASLVRIVTHADVPGTHLAGVLASHHVDMQRERPGEDSYAVG
jgi:hypothetical protein